jgi:hypothetical protein
MATISLETVTPRLRTLQRRALVVSAAAGVALLVLACALACVFAARHRAAHAIATNEESIAPSAPAFVLTKERDSFDSAKSGDPTAHGRAESIAEVPYIEVEDEPAKAAPKKTARNGTVWSSIKRFFSKRGS